MSYFDSYYLIIVNNLATCDHQIKKLLIATLDCKPEVAMAMMRWAYTDDLELNEDDTFLIDLMKLANRFQLQQLRERSVCPVDVCWPAVWFTVQRR